MGRRRKTDAERRAERFADLYNRGKRLTGLTEVEIGKAIGISERTLRVYRRDPEKFIGAFAELGKIFNWSNEDVISIVYPKK